MKVSARSLWLAAVVTWIAAACSSSTGPAISRNDPGTGTHTLKAVGDISATDVPGSSNFNTTFEVVLTNSLGNPVSSASVTINNPNAGNITLTESVAGSGDYLASRTLFYDGDFGLTVIRGADTVRNVVVGGVSRFSIVPPPARLDTLNTATQALTVRWTVPSQAKTAAIETRDYPNTTIPDTGAYVIPGASNPARPDQRVRVFRNNEVDIAGGLAGSILTLRVRASVDPFCVRVPGGLC